MARLVLSLNERLILHLSEMDKHKDDPEVPVGASQEGIAQRLGTGVHTVSRMLSSIVKEGLVSERLAHVRGAPKRRKAYSLTEMGMKVAQSLRTDIAGRKMVLEHDGKAQEMSFEEAIRRIGSISGITPGFPEMVDLAIANDVIRMEMFPRQSAGKRCSPEFVERSQGRPKVENFFGRDAERKAILERLDSPDTSTVLIWGMPGIGKSTLASKLFDELSGKRTMFWYSFRGWDTESSFLSALSDFLVSAGRSDTVTGLKRGSSPAEMFMPLVNDLSGCGMVMFLDDIQKCSRQVTSLLSMVTEAARVSKSSKIVLLSRTIPGFFSNAVQGNILVELAGLDRDSAWHMAQSMNAKDSVRIVDESHGHPLLLSLMARGGPGQSKGDVISFIEREVYSAVSEKERKVLEMLSVFRHPVPVDAVPDSDYAVVAGLRQRALVVEQEDGIWTHDLLKDFFTSHLSAQAKKEYHSLAAAYCDKNPAAEWKLETLYHLVEADSWAEALRVAIVNASELASDFPEETLALVSKIPSDSGSHRENAELLFIRGQLHEELGSEESALADFERSLSLLGAEEDVAKRALVLETQARLRSEVRRWSEALSDHQKALHIYERSNDKEGQTREWLNIGGVLRKKGDFAKAREAYMKALSLATKDEDRPSEAACLNNLGLLDRDEGRLRDAEARLRESVRLAHVVKDPSGEARGLENLAELLRVEHRLAEMADLLLESSEAFRRAGEMEEYKRLQAACAEALGELGKHAQGIHLAEAALENPDIRKRKGLFQKSPRFDSGDLALSEAIVDLHRLSLDMKRAQKELVRFIEMAGSLGDQAAIARGRLLQAMVQEDVGDLDSSAKSLDDAERMLKTAGNSEGLIAVHMRRGALEEKRLDFAAAARHYQEAANQAERIGNEFARMMAREKLDSVMGQASR
jgi:tetratricopeptide (TPR) repeat protein/DNA-binding MarR family transcriptional regulator